MKGSTILDMSTRRLNLTIPAHFDALLDQLSELSGRAKSSYVLDAVTAQARHWKDEVTRINAVLKRPEAPQAASGAKREVLPASDVPPLSRQQRRLLERQQKKKGGEN